MNVCQKIFVGLLVILFHALLLWGGIREGHWWFIFSAFYGALVFVGLAWGLVEIFNWLGKHCPHK